MSSGVCFQNFANEGLFLLLDHEFLIRSSVDLKLWH